jgi:hypothetical protein
MTIDITWGRGDGAATVASPAELDAVLDTVAQRDADDLPTCVTLVAPGGTDFPAMLDICVGHPERSFAYHVAADGSSAWGYEPDLDAGPAFTFDYAGAPTDAWPERARITNSTVRIAARQFLIKDGQRPTILSWEIME